MNAFNYLTRHLDEWLDKPVKIQRIILDELCNDWAKTQNGKDHAEFFEAVNNPDYLKYWRAL